MQGWQRVIYIILVRNPSHTIPTHKKIEDKWKTVEVNRSNTSPAVTQGSAATNRISIPMCDQSTVCNSQWNTRHK